MFRFQCDSLRRGDRVLVHDAAKCWRCAEAQTGLSAATRTRQWNPTPDDERPARPHTVSMR